MKTLKFALMCAAALALVACEQKPETTCPECGEDPCICDDGGSTYVQLIDVADASLADWDNVPAEYLAVATLPENSVYDGLKSLKVYADEMYINLAVEYDPEVITDLVWPGFHVYINTDNSAETGYASGQWADPSFDILLETAVFASGEPRNYDPALFWWWGEAGSNDWNGWYDPAVGEPSSENKWGAVVGEDDGAGIGTSQLVGNVFEIQLVKELISTPSPWADKEFTLAIDIQQNWTTAGALPAVILGEAGESVPSKSLTVKFNK